MIAPMSRQANAIGKLAQNYPARSLHLQRTVEGETVQRFFTDQLRHRIGQQYFAAYQMFVFRKCGSWITGVSTKPLHRGNGSSQNDHHD